MPQSVAADALHGTTTFERPREYLRQPGPSGSAAGSSYSNVPYTYGVKARCPPPAPQVRYCAQRWPATADQPRDPFCTQLHKGDMTCPCPRPFVAHPYSPRAHTPARF